MAEFRRDARLDQPRVSRRVPVPKIDSETFGRFAEVFARFMGTPRFIAYMTIFVLVWIVLNIVGLYGLRWDPYPFILLNLFFSTQASYAAPLILLAQNRQANRDRVTMEEDRRRAAMQKEDTEYLAREIASLRIALGEVATRDFLRSELVRLIEELDQAATRRQKTERKELRREARRAARRAAGAEGLDEPFDEFGDDAEPLEQTPPRAPRG
ncbi:hypothetical protein GCM10023322_03990 [Rugosimonospora acidiphila]|uniref:DUF1003 domain-containing protein n=1 Tax=Rugosimonospora acidiphila TaxID=556531 RepID=A0ABP9RIU8_9ACTN